MLADSRNRSASLMPRWRRALTRPLASPQALYRGAGRLIPWFSAVAVAFAAAGLFAAFAAAPAESRHGDAHRIVYMHVPAAWMSMLVYACLVAWAGAGLLGGSRLAPMMALSLAPTGAVCAFLALWSGVIWSKPTWGTWWVWDARLTVELLLLCLCVGFMALHGLIDDPVRADRASGVLALAGAVGVPVVYLALHSWQARGTGAQGPLRFAPSVDSPAFPGLLLMGLALWMYAIAVSLSRLRCVILEREQDSDWVSSWCEGAGAPR